ncbi:MAG: MiaB/RimO family radical SAM methylthiotransferase, partial [Bacteriovoracaceae bacterium]|nr:MiaB/RimO family radical SAM methylthiotransferase [Bacteriovoracaceae bacterium]
MQLDPNLGRTAALHTMGCRLNFSESGRILEQLEAQGFKIVDFGRPAALIIINTCVVTKEAEREVGQRIRMAKKVAPTSLVVVMGCAAQVQQGVAEADLVLGNEDKFTLTKFLADLPPAPQAVFTQRPSHFWPGATSHLDGHTRGFLKVQDGCDYVCSYCLIPHARGPARAPAVELIVQEAQKLLAQGIKEIILTGVNIGEFKSPQGEDLSDLLKALLALPMLERLRISSVEPNTITPKLLEVLAASPKAMGHFHVPLQSGDDVILTKMRRHYDTALFQEKVKLIKEYFPQGAIGTDIIVGFPRETEQNFKNTYDFLASLPISHFHVFPFSRRPKTIAYNLPAQVPPEVKKQR